MGDEDFGSGENTVAGKHVDQVVASEGWDTRGADQVYRDKRRRRRKRNCVHAGELEVEGVGSWSLVVGEG